MSQSELKGKHILLGVSGGIAAYKIPSLVRLLKKADAEVRVLMTRDAAQFVTPLTLATVSGAEVLTDIFPTAHSAPALNWTQHITLGEWADVFVLAPATAHTLARLANGLCDDMLTAAFISLRHGKPRLLFPAMDEEMYRAPTVQRNLQTLAADGCRIIDPEHGSLASGLVGTGRLPEPETIFHHIETELHTQLVSQLSISQPSVFLPLTDERLSYAGKRVLITAGGTREKIDRVRFISNYSSGRMGFALAAEAASQGAAVTLITGKTHLETPPNVERIDIESAAEMHAAVMTAFPTCDVFISAAAVADYRPAEIAEGKLKKSDDALVLHLVKTPDILSEAGQRKTAAQLCIGFALEVQDALQHATEKLRRKNLDLIVLNSADAAGAGFEVETNLITLIDKDGTAAPYPLMSKREAARIILEKIVTLFVPD